MENTVNIAGHLPSRPVLVSVPDGPASQGSRMPGIWSPIPTSLEGIDAPQAPEFSVWLSPEALHFAARCRQRPRCQAQPKLGNFRPELWREDVAELFIGSRDQSGYLEINLSPFGEWWTCLFTRYRQPCPAETAPPLGVRAELSPYSPETAGWSAALSLPRSYLNEHLGFGTGSGIPMNACFILGERGDRQHFSWQPLPAGRPDFHRIDLCAPLQIAG